MKTKIEQVDLQFVEKYGEKKGSVTQKFELPKRECRFCGRVTNSSADGKVCLVCGMVHDGH